MGEKWRKTWRQNQRKIVGDFFGTSIKNKPSGVKRKWGGLIIFFDKNDCLPPTPRGGEISLHIDAKF